MSETKFPGPDATREEIAAWEAEQPKHEAPPMENGPSVVCSACGRVRVRWINGLPATFCKSCEKTWGKL